MRSDCSIVNHDGLANVLRDNFDPQAIMGGTTIDLTIFCPFVGCAQHSKTEGAREIKQPVLCQHLRDCHKHELYRLNDDKFLPLGIYVCRECEDYVVLSEKG